MGMQKIMKMLDKGADVKKRKTAGEPRRNIRQSIEDGKEVECLHTEAPQCVQDAIEIYRVHPDGIFEILPGVYSKSYYFFSGQYWLLGEEEKILLADQDTKVRVGLNCGIQYSYIKRPLKSDSLIERTHIPADEYPELSGKLNEVIREKQMESTQGMEEVKLITLTVRKKSIEAARAELIAKEDRLRRGMAETGSRISPLGTRERLLLFRDFYQRGNKRPFHCSMSLDRKTVYRDFRNDIAPQVFVQKPDYIQTGKDTFIRVLYAAEYAQELEDDLTHSILSLPHEMIFSVNHTEISGDAVRSRIRGIMYQLERKKQKEQQNNNKNGFYQQGFSFSIQQEEKKAKKLAEECGEEKMFFLSATIALTCSSMEELESATQAVFSLGDKKGVRFEVHENLQREGLATALPYGVRYTRTMRNLLATSAFCYHPYWSTEIMENGIWYGNNQITHNPILFDRRNLDNPHALVFGSSGSTKSGTIKLEHLQILAKKMGNVIIFDPTGEYKSYAKSLGGVYADISMKSGVRINPLEIPFQNVSQQDFMAKKAELLTNIMRSRMKETCSSSHEAILDMAVASMYEEFFDRNNRQHRQPVLADLIRHIHEAPQRKMAEYGETATDNLKLLYEKTAEEICMAFSVLTTGTLRFFSGESNLNIWDSRLAVVGLSDVPKNLYDVAVTFFLDYVETVAAINRAKGIDTYFTIDELHELIKSLLISNHLTTRWKTARHAGLVLTGILQDITNLQEHPVCRELLTNSSTTVILSQKPGNMRVIMKECSISEDEARYAAGCLQGTGIVKFGNSVLPFDARIPEEMKKGVLWELLDTDTVGQKRLQV